MVQLKSVLLKNFALKDENKFAQIPLNLYYPSKYYVLI